MGTKRRRTRSAGGASLGPVLIFGFFIAAAVTWWTDGGVNSTLAPPPPVVQLDHSVGHSVPPHSIHSAQVNDTAGSTTTQKTQPQLNQIPVSQSTPESASEGSLDESSGSDPTGTSESTVMLARSSPTDDTWPPKRPLPQPVDPKNLSVSDINGVKLVAGFDCSPKNVVITNTGPERFEVKFQSGRDRTGYFLFQLENAAGKEVTITLTNVPKKWSTLNPVVYNSTDLADLNNGPSGISVGKG